VEIAPETPVKGDTVQILIKADPEEELTVSISLEMVLQVSKGEYEYELSDVEIPSTPNTFTIKAVDVENLSVSVKMPLNNLGYIWVTKTVDAEDGVATVSQGNVPEGTYDVVIFGFAVEGASKVNIEVTASASIMTDENGLYTYSYNTSNIPPGEFTIKIGEITKVVTLYKTRPAPSTPGAAPPEETLLKRRKRA